MVGCDNIIQDSQPIFALCFEQPLNPSLPILNEFKQKFSFVASVRDMPSLAWDIMSFGSGQSIDFPIWLFL